LIRLSTWSAAEADVAPAGALLECVGAADEGVGAGAAAGGEAEWVLAGGLGLCWRATGRRDAGEALGAAAAVAVDAWAPQAVVDPRGWPGHGAGAVADS
jgi:hypothetical protein